jgi:hypothetical protein
MNKQRLKEILIEECQSRLNELQKLIDDLSSSLKGETKSTSGDKHETGRAMVHLEMEKLQTQHVHWEKYSSMVHSLSTEKHEQIASGSLIKLPTGYFYLSVGIGKLTINETNVYCIAMNAPLAQQLIGKKDKECIIFQGKEMTITELH